jgi:hypothetical protein
MDRLHHTQDALGCQIKQWKLYTKSVDSNAAQNFLPLIGVGL